MAPELKAIVGGSNKARFSHYRDGNFFYAVEVDGKRYSFPISLEEAKGATMLAEFKAITLMRWIRKALADNTFQPAR
jgi:hypothetical protein